MITTSIGKKLPQPLLDLAHDKLAFTDMGALPHTLTGNELMVLFKIDSPAPGEIEEFNGDFTLGKSYKMRGAAT